MKEGESKRPAWAPDLRRITHFLGPPEEHWEVLLLLAVPVGLIAGGSAVALRHGVHFLFSLLAEVRASAFAVVIPAAGAAVGVFVVSRLFREPHGHGVPEVIRAACREGGRMPVRSIFSRWIGSLVNVAAGGSAGLEGPIAHSAAATGSVVGGIFHLDERRRTVLLACGVAGGISGVFNAPMTGMIFATEVVLAEWSAFAIVPIVVASVCGTEVSRLLLGDVRSFLHAHFEMQPYDLLACAVLGILAGFCSTGVTRLIRVLHWVAARLPRARLVAPILMGLFVGAVALLAPGAVGEGYETAREAITGHLPAAFSICLLLLAAKIVATGLTLGSGAPGGIFAPSLVIGSLLGVAFVRGAEVLIPGSPLAAEGSYALVGMGGLVAGVMQAPLTGIFLVMEVTGGYEVILPLMIVSVLSLVVARRFDRHSLYTVELAESGELLRPGTDPRILADVRVFEALDEDVTAIHGDLTLAEFSGIVAGSRRNHFPVLATDSDEYLGMLDLTGIRELMLDPEVSRVTLVSTLMDTEVPTVPFDATLSEAIDLLERAEKWVLPVTEGDRFVGLVSKSTLFDRYRRELLAQSPG